MNYKVILLNILLPVFCISTQQVTPIIAREYIPEVQIYTTNKIAEPPVVVEHIIEEVLVPAIPLSDNQQLTDDIYPISNKEIELIALVTMAEAEGESDEGKRLVIDTILNRIDSDHFPDDVSEVIYQKNQFSSMWNGRVDKCVVTDNICALVKDELKHKTNSEVMFFTAGKYGEYGTPLFRVGGHYFSSDY